MCEDFGTIFDNSFPACAFYFSVEISSRTLIPLFKPGSVQSGSASWNDCGRVFPDELHVNSFLDSFPHYAWSGIVSPLWLRRASDVCMFRCNLPPALLAEWPGSFTCHCGNTGVEWTLNKSQHTKLTLEKKILRPPLTGFELAPFRSRVWRSNQQAISAPSVKSYMKRLTHDLINVSLHYIAKFEFFLLGLIN